MMRGAVLYGPRDIRFEDRETPKIVAATDAIIRIAATCVCGSDLWPYRGLQPINGPTPMGHEYCGIVEEVGGAVRSVKPGHHDHPGPSRAACLDESDAGRFSSLRGMRGR
jgi:threonine dehydrogenase-like Zn-dependent dehydrogenase